MLKEYKDKNTNKIEKYQRMLLSINYDCYSVNHKSISKKINNALVEKLLLNLYDEKIDKKNILHLLIKINNIVKFLSNYIFFCVKN